MKAVRLDMDKDAPFLGEPYFDNEVMTNFEGELMRVHYDQWSYQDKGVEIDPWVTLDEIEQVVATHAVPVERIEEWQHFFNNMGCEWIEEAMRSSQPQFEDEHKYATQMSEAWYALEEKLKELEEVVKYRVCEIVSETIYDTRAVSE